MKRVDVCLSNDGRCTSSVDTLFPSSDTPTRKTLIFVSILRSHQSKRPLSVTSNEVGTGSQIFSWGPNGGWTDLKVHELPYRLFPRLRGTPQ